MDSRNPTRYNPEVSSLAGLMLGIAPPGRDRRGITVLGLILLIVAVVVVAVLIGRYVAV